MSKYLNYLILFLTFTTLSVKAEINVIQYRGWNNCYQIKNKTCEVIICTVAGGRVLKYALNGQNSIYENRLFDGKLLADYQANRPLWADGGRFDIGPNTIPGKMRDAFFMGKWSANTTSAFSVKITNPIPNELGIEVSREFILNKKGSNLQVNQTMKNVTHKVILRHFWNRIFCPAGGEITLPTDRNSIHRKTYRLMNDTTVDISERLTKRINSLQFTTIKPTIKMGTDSKKGWMTYLQNGLLITMKFDIDKKGDYSDSDNNTTIFYTNGIVTELEPISPIYMLKPREMRSFNQVWKLKDVR